MSILKEMGIRQWRLRATTNGVDVVIAAPEAPLGQEAPLENKSAPDVTASISESTETTETSSLNVNSLSSAVPLTTELNLAERLQAEPSQVEPSQVEPLPAATNRVHDPLADFDWQGLQNLVDGQSQCLSCGAESSLLGAGDPNANWLFVIDAPHRQDIVAQQFLNSRAGQLFDAMLSAVGLDRRSVYMTSVFKCVASDDLSQTPNCDKILHRQIELIQPHVVIALGEFTAQSVIKANESLSVLRQSEQTCFRTKVPIVPTFTPAQMLEEPALKAAVWQDLKRCLTISPTQP